MSLIRRISFLVFTVTGSGLYASTSESNVCAHNLLSAHALSDQDILLPELSQDGRFVWVHYFSGITVFETIHGHALFSVPYPTDILDPIDIPMQKPYSVSEKGHNMRIRLFHNWDRDSKFWRSQKNPNLHRGYVVQLEKGTLLTADQISSETTQPSLEPVFTGSVEPTSNEENSPWRFRITHTNRKKDIIVDEDLSSTIYGGYGIYPSPSGDRVMVVYSRPIAGNTLRELRLNSHESLSLVRVYETSTGILVYDGLVDLSGEYFKSLVVKFSHQEDRIAIQRGPRQIEVIDLRELTVSLNSSISVQPSHPEDEFYGFSFNATGDLIMTTQSSKVLIHRFENK